MHHLTSLWGIELLGKSPDVQNLFGKINGSIKAADDFFISRLVDCFVLRTARWDNASDFPEARSIAEEDLRLLTSCMYTLDGSLGLSIGTIFRFREDGGIDQQLTSDSVYVRINPSDHATPKLFKELVNAARVSIPLRTAASEVTAEGGWFEIYKALEGLKRYYGNEAKLIKAFASKKSQVELMKRTANSFRHAQGVFDPIANPIALSDARDLIRQMIIQTLSSVASPTSESSVSFRIPNINSPEGYVKFGLKAIVLGAVDGTSYVGETLAASIK